MNKLSNHQKSLATIKAQLKSKGKANPALQAHVADVSKMLDGMDEFIKQAQEMVCDVSCMDEDPGSEALQSFNDNLRSLLRQADVHIAGAQTSKRRYTAMLV